MPGLFLCRFHDLHEAYVRALKFYIDAKPVFISRSFMHRFLQVQAGAVTAISLLFLIASPKPQMEPDFIFRKSTVLKLLTPNDKLATYAIDDPEIEGSHVILPYRSVVGSRLGRHSRRSV
jgi:hypothetical protein